MSYFRYPGSLRIGVRNEVVTAVAQPGLEQVTPKQMLLVLLNGHQRFRLGDEEFLLSTLLPADPGPKALMLWIGRDCALEYLESHGQPLVKIAVSTDRDWLDQAGQDEEAPAPVPAHAAQAYPSAPQGGEALSWRLWTPDAGLQQLARDVVAAYAPGSAGNLALMSRAIELYRNALAALERGPAAGEAGAPQPRGAIPSGDPRIPALIAWLAQHRDDGALGPEDLARGCGIGLRSLQRLCRRSLNCSPRDFIRAQRLAAAYESLCRGGANVAQAAHIAGYASTASFSTAFKREFGLTPARAQDGV